MFIKHLSVVDFTSVVSAQNVFAQSWHAGDQKRPTRSPSFRLNDIDTVIDLEFSLRIWAEVSYGIRNRDWYMHVYLPFRFAYMLSLLDPGPSPLLSIWVFALALSLQITCEK